MKFLYTLLLLSVMTTANAQISETITTVMPCGETKLITDKLKNSYNENPIIIGIADDEVNSLMSLWANTKTGTWTLVASSQGLSCIIGTGKNLKIVEPAGKTI